MHIRKFARIQCLLIALVLSWHFALATTYYVSSTEGDDSRTATEAQNPATPWRTLSKIKPISLLPGDRVLLKRGDEFRETFTPTRSGVSGNPIVYGAYGPGDDYPKIMGSDLITAWKPASFNSSVYYADVPFAVKDLFANRKRQTVARYPNSGWLRVDDMVGQTGLKDADLTQGGGYFNGGTIRIRTRDWAYEIRTIASYSSGEITFDKVTKYESGANYGYFIDGLLSLLDAPGEWYYDAAQGRVYYWPESGQTPDNLKIEGMNRDDGISVSWGTRFVTFEHIEFMHHKLSLNVPNNNEGIEINDCVFHDITVRAIAHAGKDGKIQRNRISDCLDQAINSIGDNALIYDNDVRSIAMVPGYGGSDWGYVGIDANGPNSLISHNRIDGVGYIGLGTSGANTVIEKNLVQNCVALLNDGSAISIGFFAKDITIRNNFMLSCKGNLETKGSDLKNIANGFYFGGNNNQNITLQGNTMAYNGGSGILAIETYNSTIADNTLFSNDTYGLYFLEMSDGKYGSQHNNTIRNNIFYATHENSVNVYSLEFNAPQDNYGSFSNNYYFNPYSNTSHKFQHKSDGWNYDYFSPSAFRSSSTNSDPGGKSSFLSLSPYVTGCNPGAVAGSELVVNGNFNTDLQRWTSAGGCGLEVGAYNSHPLLSAGAARITNNVCYEATFYQTGINVVKDQFYKLTFSCAANSVGNLSVSLAKSNWAPIGLEKAQVFIFERIKNTYTYIFKTSDVYPDSELTNARLIFRNRTPYSEVWIDDISLVPVDATEITYDDPKERSQLFINPSDTPKTIPLPYTFWDLDQNEVSGSITLAPWTSRVLIKKDNAPCGVNQLPTVKLDSPVGGASFAIGSTVNLTATASDVDGRIVKVEFYQGNVKLGESTTSPYSFAWINPPAGSYQISARATDDKEGIKVSEFAAITVAGVVAPIKQNQTITFAPLSNKLTTDAAFTLSASSSSNLPVSLSIVSGPATVSGNTLTLTGTAGTVIVRASQGGDASFNAAPAVERSFQVSAPSSPTKQDQTITFAPLSNKLTTDAAFTLSASSSSNLPVSLSLVSGPATVLGNTVTLTGTTGTVIVRASQGGDASFNPALAVERTFQVSAPSSPTKQDQNITFAPLPNKLTTDAAFTLWASSSSNLPVSLSIVSGPATLSGNTVTLTGTDGTVTVRASQGGDASFNPAPVVEQSFQVSAPSSPTKQEQTITFAPLPNKLTTDAAFTLSASSSSNLPVSLSLVSGPATVLGNTVTLTGTTGTVIVRASQGGDASFNPALAVEQSFQVSAPGTTPPPATEPSPEPPLIAQLTPRNIFSPNGDGVNEIWEVEGIEQQPELRVLIFNSYGQRVFQAQPYTNSWDGAGLPEGVYYYQVQNPQGKPVKKGAITLVR